MANTSKTPAVQKGRSSQLTLWLSVGFVGLIIMSLPSVVLIFFGLLPTIVAFIIDRSKQRNASFCVGGINFCGVFPYMMDLWAGENSMDMSIRILTDVFSLVIMYSAAGFGWMIYMTLPPVIAAFISVMAQHKLATLRASQRQLIEEWGEDVSASQEVLDLRQEIAANEGTDGETGEMPEPLEVDDFLEGIDSILD
ncbi:MAG TPA: hypothetical protein ENI69_08335, partial [Rhodospirillales bacterium]|nr:hypothetical protein [Rhodospirillales bacterium]